MRHWPHTPTELLPCPVCVCVLCCTISLSSIICWSFLSPRDCPLGPSPPECSIVWCGHHSWAMRLSLMIRSTLTFFGNEVSSLGPLSSTVLVAIILMSRESIAVAIRSRPPTETKFMTISQTQLWPRVRKRKVV